MFGSDRTGTIVVVTALDLEYLAVCRHLRDVRTEKHKGTVFDVGELADSGRRMVVLLAGTGNQDAAALTERAIEQFDPIAVFVVGVAGAIHDDIALGDVVVGTKVYAVHGAREDDSGPKARPVSWEPGHELRQAAHAISRNSPWAGARAQRPHVHFLPIASGEVELNSRSSPLAQQLDLHYNDAAVIEMQSAGVALAAHYNRGLPMITIRGISDTADGTPRPARETEWQKKAADNAAAFAVALAAEELNAEPRTAKPDVDDAMTPFLIGLAQAVGEQWESELERWSVSDPFPLPLRCTIHNGRSGRLDQLRDLLAGQPVHRLVLLGRSGSGKSTSVRRLVLDLLNRRSRNDPVPVLFSLGGWDHTQQHLKAWMIDQLCRDYPGLRQKITSAAGDKQSVAEVLVRTRRILPVLDGFDEINESVRGDAIEAINRIGSAVRLVLTSRIDEYRAAVTSAGRELTGAVIAELQPLDPDDVRQYLSEGTGVRWKAVTTLLAEQPDGPLAQALSTPLMVWLARVGYRTPGCPDELRAFDTREAIEDHLLGHFVTAAYPGHPTPGGRSSPTGKWTATEAREGLRFLARHLGGESDIAWWKFHRAVRRLDSVSRGVGAAVFVIGVGITFETPGWGIAVLVVFLGGWAASDRFLHNHGGDKADLPHAFQFNWRTLRREIGHILLNVFMTVATIVTVLFALAGLITVPLNNFRTIAVFAAIALVALSFVGWWIVRWVRYRRRRGQPQAPGSVTVVDLDRAVSARSTLRGDRAVALSVLIMAPSAALLGGVVISPLFPIWAMLGRFVPFALGMGACWVMVSPYFRFCATRVIFAVRGRFPLRAMRFLEDAHDRGVLRQVGAVYQFRHDRLKDRLRA